MSKDRKSILIIDDNEDHLHTCSLFFEKNDYGVLTADSAVEGLAVLKKRKDVDVIIVDMLMPDLNGEEFSILVKSKDEFNMIPIIILTAAEQHGDDLIGKYKAADLVCSKSSPLKKLLADIQLFQS